MLSPPVLVGMAIFCPLRRVPLTMIETISSEPFSATSMVRSRFPEGYGTEKPYRTACTDGHFHWEHLSCSANRFTIFMASGMCFL